jgi:hypothetical protein
VITWQRNTFAPNVRAMLPAYGKAFMEASEKSVVKRMFLSLAGT